MLHAIGVSVIAILDVMIGSRSSHNSAQHYTTVCLVGGGTTIMASAVGIDRMAEAAREVKPPRRILVSTF